MSALENIALIPAYQPDHRLCELTAQLAKAGLKIVIVDDGSGPDYAEAFRKAEPPAKVVRLPLNQGKGAALKDGLAYIRAHFPESRIVTLDCDGQHTVPDALNVLAGLDEAPGALILGCRSFGPKVPWHNRLGNLITRGVYRLATGVRLADTQTGLRAFPSAMIEKFLAVKGTRYEYEMNVLLELGKEKWPIREVPIATIYHPAEHSSHFSAFRDSWRIYAEILRFSASSLASFLIDYGLFNLFYALAFSLGSAAVVLANVLARVISASVNFTLNRRFVFHSAQDPARAARRYFLLALGILAGNTCLLVFLTGPVGLSGPLAKLATELAFFIISWAVQHCLIFPAAPEEGR